MSPARPGWRRSSLRLPLVLTEADSHLGLANRLLAGRARRVCLAFPIPGREGDRYLVTGRPVPAEVLRGRAGAGPEALRDRAQRSAACWSSAAARARTRSTSARPTAFAGADEPRLPRPSCRRAGATIARAAGAAGRDRTPTATRCSSTSPTSATAWPPATWCSAAPAARSSSSPRPDRPAVLVPYPHATADHQTTNADWMARAGAAVVIPDAELRPAAAARGGERVARRRGPPRAMATASRSLAQARRRRSHRRRDPRRR